MTKVLCSTLLKAVILASLVYFGPCLGQETPENDQCENALGPLTIDGDIISSSTIGVSTETPPSIILFQCGGQTFDVETPGVWFEVFGTAGRLRASTCAEETNFTNRITIFEADDCDNRSCQHSGKDQDPNCPYANSSVVEWNSIPGSRYYVLVHDLYSDESGNFGLTITDVTEPPDNDSCENALELEEDSTAQGTTVGATLSTGVKCDRCIDGGPQNPGVWYRIPPADMDTEVTVTTCGILLSFNISVFSGDVCGEFSCHDATPNLDFTCEDGLPAFQLTFVADSGQEYYVYVHAAESSDDLNIGYFGIAFFRSQIEGDSNSDITESGANGFAYSLWMLMLLFLAVFRP
jgi:hypothetical protein